MIRINDHQTRIWKDMIKLTDNYLLGKIGFNYLTSSLEGALDAAEIKDGVLIKKWYEIWSPLEMINAETEIEVSDEEKIKTVQKMKTFLENQLKLETNRDTSSR